MILTEELTKTFRKRKRKRGPAPLSSQLISFLRNRHNKVVALDHVSLHIKRGETFGLIGLNGAGKTTFCRILSTMITPDSGKVFIDGHDVLKEDMTVKQKVGIVGSEFSRSLYWRLTGKQNLKFFAGLYEMEKEESKEKIAELLDMFGLSEWQDELVMRYSTGMKQKLCIAKALLNNADVLLFDEPTAGLDPVSRDQLKRTIETELKDKTILWTSHNLTEIEEMCNRIALIHHGKILLQGDLVDIKREYDIFKRVQIEFDSDSSQFFQSIEGVHIEDSNRILIASKELTDILYDVMKVVRQHELRITDIQSFHVSLEDIFLDMMGDRA
jgi:ABC-2 type transport system ATP-binding protein